MATAIKSGAKNNKAALATAMSNTRLPIDAEGSLRAVRRERRLRYALLPGHSTGLTEMKARPFRSGVTLSRLERTAIMVAIALAFCWNLSATRKNAAQAHLCRQRISAAGEAFALAKLHWTRHTR
jgi:hypothetical protein